MQKQIIAYIDPLNIQHHVIKYATHLARNMDMPLLLYTVLQYVTPNFMVAPVGTPGGTVVTSNPSSMPLAWQADVKAEAKKYCEEVKRQYLRTEYEVDTGLTGDAVVNKVKSLHRSISKRSPYLLVMPKVSEHSWWNDVVGTSETTIAEQTPCPVLFVPEEADFDSIDRVMYLADEQSLTDYAYPGFNFLRGFAEKMKAKITVGFMAGELSTQKGYDVGAAMERLRQGIPFQKNYEYRFFSDMSVEHLLTLAAISSMDVIAFPFRESSFISRFFDNEITRTLLLKTDAPVLVF